MATFKSFRPLLPRWQDAASICAPPYDVMSREEAAAMAAGKPQSILWLSRPEINFDAATDPHAGAVYEKAAAVFRTHREHGAYFRAESPCHVICRITKGSHSQTGLIGLASIDEYEENVVRRHELTRPDKVSDRADHMQALGAQTGLVYLTFRPSNIIATVIAKTVKQEPVVTIEGQDGATHEAWLLEDPADLAAVLGAFASMDALYIADGHHRCASAAEVRARHRHQHPERPDTPRDFLLALAIPADNVRILGYHRVLRDLNGYSVAELLHHLGHACEVTHLDGEPPASMRGSVDLYLDGTWHRLTWRPAILDTEHDAVGRLDAALLQAHVLEPIFGIADIRTDKRIDFVGGARGLGELMRLVDSGAHACAFALNPVSIEELMAVADEEGLMPPKSTWFDPKPLDGLAIHLFE